MPAHAFICPNGNTVAIKDCLNQCPQPMRCMFLPTLRSIASSLNRNLEGASVLIDNFFKVNTTFIKNLK